MWMMRTARLHVELSRGILGCQAATCPIYRIEEGLEAFWTNYKRSGETIVPIRPTEDGMTLASRFTASIQMEYTGGTNPAQTIYYTEPTALIRY